jgi:hypothetical protein
MRAFLRGLASSTSLDEKAPDFFVFSQLSAEPAFTFDCELVPGRLESERAGEYFAFLGLFVKALTGHFGAISVEDA